MNTSCDPILFLSGAGLPGWIWDGVRRDLGEGHETSVADRPRDPEARLRDYVRAAVDSAPNGQFVIVAHSSGGVMATEVAELVPDRVSAILGICAVVPRPGGSFISAMPAPNRWILGAAMRFAGTRPPSSAIRRRLASGVDEQVAERIVADFEPESLGLYRDRTGDRSWTGWLGYLQTTDDRELPIARQRQHAENLGAAWQDDLRSGHLPMLEDRQGVVASIIRFLHARPRDASARTD